MDKHYTRIDVENAKEFWITEEQGTTKKRRDYFTNRWCRNWVKLCAFNLLVFCRRMGSSGTGRLFCASFDTHSQLGVVTWRLFWNKSFKNRVKFRKTRPFNALSPPQLLQILYDELALNIYNFSPTLCRHLPPFHTRSARYTQMDAREKKK